MVSIKTQSLYNKANEWRLIMKNKIKSWFALTNQGASDLIRASILSFQYIFKYVSCYVTYDNSR